MMNYWLVNFSFFVYFSLNNCLETSTDQQADLEVDFDNHGQVFDLQAFKSSENDKILVQNSSINHNKLRWYSIGVPLLLKTKSDQKEESLFHFTRKGFSAHIRMLTIEHKMLLAQEVKRKYKIDIELNQIDNLILSSFTCKILLYINSDPTEITGSVKSFRTFPLRIDFIAPIASKEIEWFNQSLSDGESIQLDCVISTKNKEFSSEFSLYTDNLITVCGLKRSDIFYHSDDSSKLILIEFFVILLILMYKDFNCNSGGLCSCLNRGKCTSNGKCICEIGFTGLTCSSCNY